MNARESLCALLESLAEINKRIPRQLLVDFVVGNATNDIKKHKLNEHELFGCGEGHEEEHYGLVINKAIKDKLIKKDRTSLSISVKGRKFLNNDGDAPYFVEEEDQTEPSKDAIARAQRLTQTDMTMAMAQPQEHMTHATRVKIKLIQAMDRQLALDYFAEQNNMAFEEVLDALEEMKKSGRSFDITYFLDEVMDKTSQQELLDYLNEVDGDLKRTLDEWGDVYKPEEIRLVRLKWEKDNTTL